MRGKGQRWSLEEDKVLQQAIINGRSGGKKTYEIIDELVSNNLFPLHNRLSIKKRVSRVCPAWKCKVRKLKDDFSFDYNDKLTKLAIQRHLLMKKLRVIEDEMRRCMK